MAGHSKFKNIMHRKGGQDAKRAKLFTKLAREITVAAKMGAPEPENNPRLRAAIIAARGQSMPKDNIERAIKKAEPGADNANYEEMRYEGYGPSNVALIVEALTDNRNRTASELRAIFSRAGGLMGETNSVMFNFERIGLIQYVADVADADSIFEVALEAGASDVESSEDGHEIITSPEDLHSVKDALEAKFGEPTSAALDWKSLMTVDLDVEKATKLMKLIDTLEDNDDVQTVSGNFVISDEVAAALEG